MDQTLYSYLEYSDIKKKIPAFYEFRVQQHDI